MTESDAHPLAESDDPPPDLSPAFSPPTVRASAPGEEQVADLSALEWQNYCHDRLSQFQAYVGR